MDSAFLAKLPMANCEAWIRTTTLDLVKSRVKVIIFYVVIIFITYGTHRNYCSNHIDSCVVTVLGQKSKSSKLFHMTRIEQNGPVLFFNSNKHQ